MGLRYRFVCRNPLYPFEDKYELYEYEQERDPYERRDDPYKENRQRSRAVVPQKFIKIIPKVKILVSKLLSWINLREAGH